MWISRLFRAKKSTIQPPPPKEPAPSSPEPLTLKGRLLETLRLVDLNSLVKDPAISMIYLTLYTESSEDLIRESIAPSRSRQILAVSLQSFFKQSHLTPTLVMERLAGVFQKEPISNYAKHDIEIIIRELLDLSGLQTPSRSD